MQRSRTAATPWIFDRRKRDVETEAEIRNLHMVQNTADKQAEHTFKVCLVEHFEEIIELLETCKILLFKSKNSKLLISFDLNK